MSPKKHDRSMQNNLAASFSDYWFPCEVLTATVGQKYKCCFHFSILERDKILNLTNQLANLQQHCVS